MIPTKMRYKTHDQELFAIFEVFKSWRHYLKGFKHEVLVEIDYNNFGRFIDTKSLNRRQVELAQKRSKYHFQFDYCHRKANAATNALSRFPQKNKAEEKTLGTENSKILCRL